jgi:hypothetical protein
MRPLITLRDRERCSSSDRRSSFPPLEPQPGIGYIAGFRVGRISRRNRQVMHDWDLGFMDPVRPGKFPGDGG